MLHVDAFLGWAQDGPIVIYVQIGFDVISLKIKKNNCTFSTVFII